MELRSGQMLLELDVRRRQLDRALQFGDGLVEMGLEAETDAQEVVCERIARVGLKRLARERDGARVVLVIEFHDRGITSGRGVRRVESTTPDEARRSPRCFVPSSPGPRQDFSVPRCLAGDQSGTADIR